MAGKSVTHSDKWWLTAPAYVLRCVGTYKYNGEQCRRVADDGSVVCDQHGGAAPQVRRRAAERIAVTADEAAQKLAAWMDDAAVPFQVRAKIAQDLLDRAGLGAAQVHKIMPIVEDPIEALFASILSDPEGTYDPVAIEASKALEAKQAYELADLIGTFDEDDIVDAEIVEDDLDDGVVVPIRRPPFEAPKVRHGLTTPKHIRQGLGLI